MNTFCCKFVCFVFITICLDFISIRCDENESINTFDLFKSRFQKTYRSIEDELEAERNFNDSLSYVLQTIGTKINAHSDLSGEEFARKFSSNIESIEASNDDYKPYACDFLPGQYPAHIDLRDIGHLTSIKNQGNCGACWAFATICTIESLLLASKQVSPCKFSLSEQNLIDCASKRGCDGEKQSTGYRFLQQNGTCESSRYPYVAKVQQCKHPFGPNYKIRDFCMIHPENPTIVKTVLAKFKAAVSTSLQILDMDKFRHYDGKSVIINDFKAKPLNHAVNIVGYGPKFGRQAWIVRNSWGTSWGDKGYAYVSQDSSIFGITKRVYVAWL
ncbi:glycosyltransferase 25 family member [Sarcoptes scabiei]|nr:glycosyltransferase 25 family member [Sarcoptes scabiei]